MREVIVLGATGSIGTSVLDVVDRHPARFRVHTLTASRNVEAMAALCRHHRPEVAVMADPKAARALSRLLGDGPGAPAVRAGEAGLVAAVRDGPADTVVSAIVGAAGLASTMAAVERGCRVLLANKESLVVAGPLLLEAARRGGAELLPVDSEHNAIYQCLPPSYGRDGVTGSGVRRVLLTASGGPFRTRAPESLSRVTPEEACAHPNWDMGRKISVDSATMMNKGLEYIEACLLFGLEPSAVEVVIHPQSVVHSLVEYVDGSVLAQLGNPDMRTPIAHALAAPERIAAGVAPLDLFAVARLEFERPDPARFPCLGLAVAALREGGTAPAVLNAANEVAVAAFLSHRLGFMAIADVVESTLAAVPSEPVTSLEQVMATDARARCAAEATIGRGGRR
ncbi:1-deoxy-D-xylulose-5-phosphate reductoisomerase [Arhodomonas aquaeolei]|uniref:1-deoxy-D-xylulose-5-phosphate reductoisomerase n=1 Tax=Arhodomonas aquaeolei TaxID=2369 RepID=UPI000370FD58|nr:1-deoxy-D-xylulose-5-phosphate reductoisomerase [Arhodomonas aquaeolei]